MKQTAVGIFKKVISSYIETEISVKQMSNELLELIDTQLLEMEKEQIIDSFHEGWLQCNIYGLPEKSRKHFETAEQYYNEIFKK